MISGKKIREIGVIQIMSDSSNSGRKISEGTDFSREGSFSHTQKFSAPDKSVKNELRDSIGCVYNALREKGYSPTSQIVGYILSGDPTYITAHNNARSIISKFESDEILEEIVNFYLANNNF